MARMKILAVQRYLAHAMQISLARPIEGSHCFVILKAANGLVKLVHEVVIDASYD
jgi:hypothetical protein